MCVSTYSPLILHETCEGIQRFDVRDQMLAARQIELAGPIDASSVACAARCLLHLQKCDPHAPVTLFINSPGGEAQSGLALYDVMRAISCPVHTVCIGTAASMAAVLFVAGDRRDMLPHSRVMIHDPLIGAGAGRQRAFRESPGRRPHAHPRHHGRRHRAAQRHVDRARLRAYGIRHLFRSGGSR